MGASTSGSNTSIPEGKLQMFGMVVGQHHKIIQRCLRMYDPLRAENASMKIFKEEKGT